MSFIRYRLFILQRCFSIVPWDSSVCWIGAKHFHIHQHTRPPRMLRNFQRCAHQHKRARFSHRKSFAAFSRCEKKILSAAVERNISPQSIPDHCPVRMLRRSSWVAKRAEIFFLFTKKEKRNQKKLNHEKGERKTEGNNNKFLIRSRTWVEIKVTQSGYTLSKWIGDSLNKL